MVGPGGHPRTSGGVVPFDVAEPPCAVAGAAPVRYLPLSAVVALGVSALFSGAVANLTSIVSRAPTECIEIDSRPHSLYMSGKASVSIFA